MTDSREQYIDKTKLTIKYAKQAGRHTGVQYKAWVSAELRDAFMQTCRQVGLAPSTVQRPMMKNFVATVAAKELNHV